MIKTADAVVIGGGVMGASIAFNLAKRGLGKVVLLEKDFLAAGSTGKSGAIIRQHYSNVVTARMALRSLRVFQNFADLVGGDAGFVETGFFIIVAPEHLEGLKANVALQQSVGINASVVSPEEVHDIDPHTYVDDLAAAAYEPESGYADPASTVTSFANAAKGFGAEVYQQTKVTGIKLDGDRVRGVVTNRGQIEAPIAISAAGPWTNIVAGMVGAELPVSPSRHQVATIRRPPGFGKSHAVYGDFTNMIYLRPETGELTLAGSIDPEEAEDKADPDNFNEGVDFEFISWSIERLCRRMPLLAQGVSRGGWAGMYSITPDWHPILDRMPGVEGMYVAAGFSGHGFKLSPAVGEMMAALIVDGHCEDPDITLFRASRFEEGDLVKGQYEYSILG